MTMPGNTRTCVAQIVVIQAEGWKRQGPELVRMQIKARGRQMC